MGLLPDEKKGGSVIKEKYPTIVVNVTNPSIG